MKDEVKAKGVKLEMVEELNSYTSQNLTDLGRLMHELSASSFCSEALLKRALMGANVHVYVNREEGRIVGGSVTRSIEINK